MRPTLATSARAMALLWPMNLLNLLSNFFILLWMPAILHGIGVSPSWAIFGTTMYGLGDPPFGAFSVIICGAGIGVGGCQPGINSLSGRIYPPMIRSTGAGWALGAGRVGTIAGPLLG